MIQKLLTISIVPLLLTSNQLKLTEEDIQNNRDYYEVIGATTGKKIKDKLYAEERVIETHITAVLAIKKALIKEGIDLANIRFLLYYDGLTISDSSPPRIWQRKSHPDTIFSPWLDLTKTVTTSGETRITIRIDATIARLISDLYSEPENKSNNDSFLSISTIRESCYSEIINKHEILDSAIIRPRITLPFNQEIQEKIKKSNQSFECTPEELREPLRYLIGSSGSYFWGRGSSAHQRVFFYCQDEAEEYYSELYPQLAIQGLEILENKSNIKPEWWIEIIDHIKPQKC